MHIEEIFLICFFNLLPPKFESIQRCYGFSNNFSVFDSCLSERRQSDQKKPNWDITYYV